MAVMMLSRSKGGFSSARLKRFVELLRRTRSGRLTTLCALALSGAGDPAMLEGRLPMNSGLGVAGVLGRSVRFGRATCAIVVHWFGWTSRIHCLSSWVGTSVRPLVFVNRRSHGRWLRRMRGERGEHAPVDVGDAEVSCCVCESWKVGMCSCSVC